MSTANEQRQLVRNLCREWPKGLWLPVGQLQRKTAYDKPAHGPVWISRTRFPAPAEPALQDALYEVCERLRGPDHIITSKEKVPLQDVGVEFIGARKSANENASEPSMPEGEKLKRLQDDCENDMTILYVHGGGLYFSSPAEYRSASARLARLTKSRVASIKYRLAPQHTFPAPVLDLLVAYSSLLYPPPHSIHQPVPAERIVLAGNSAGANLCFALTRFLLEFNRYRHDASLSFHNRRVTLPQPAGIATVCGWCDQTDSLPSWRNDGANDILGILQPALWPDYPPDECWPANPPREHPYARAVTLDHELVTPAAVKDWTGAPPMWFGVGAEERGLDGNRVVASQAARCGVPVMWMEYEGMPHEWMIMLRQLPQAGHCFEAWAKACASFANGEKRGISAVVVKMPDCRVVEMGHVRDLAPLEFEEVRRRMREMNLARPLWEGKGSASKAKI